MQDFTAENLRPGYVLASGDTVKFVSLYEANGEILVQVTAQNGEKSVYEYPADLVFYDVDTTFYEQMRERAT